MENLLVVDQPITKCEIGEEISILVTSSTQEWNSISVNRLRYSDHSIPIINYERLKYYYIVNSIIKKALEFFKMNH